MQRRQNIKTGSHPPAAHRDIKPITVPHHAGPMYHTTPWVTDCRRHPSGVRHDGTVHCGPFWDVLHAVFFFGNKYTQIFGRSTFLFSNFSVPAWCGDARAQNISLEFLKKNKYDMTACLRQSWHFKTICSITSRRSAIGSLSEDRSTYMHGTRHVQPSLPRLSRAVTLQDFLSSNNKN